MHRSTSNKRPKKDRNRPVPNSSNNSTITTTATNSNVTTAVKRGQKPPSQQHHPNARILTSSTRAISTKASNITTNNHNANNNNTKQITITHHKHKTITQRRNFNTTIPKKSNKANQSQQSDNLDDIDTTFHHNLPIFDTGPPDENIVEAEIVRERHHIIPHEPDPRLEDIGTSKEWFGGVDDPQRPFRLRPKDYIEPIIESDSDLDNIGRVTKNKPKGGLFDEHGRPPEEVRFASDSEFDEYDAELGVYRRSRKPSLRYETTTPPPPIPTITASSSFFHRGVKALFDTSDLKEKLEIIDQARLLYRKRTVNLINWPHDRDMYNFFHFGTTDSFEFPASIHLETLHPSHHSNIHKSDGTYHRPTELNSFLWGDIVKNPLNTWVMPARPANPPLQHRLTSPKELDVPLAAHILHTLAHIELNAVEMYLDTILRFAIFPPGAAQTSRPPPTIPVFTSGVDPTIWDKISKEATRKGIKLQGYNKKQMRDHVQEQIERDFKAAYAGVKANQTEAEWRQQLIEAGEDQELLDKMAWPKDDLDDGVSEKSSSPMTYENDSFYLTEGEQIRRDMLLRHPKTPLQKEIDMITDYTFEFVTSHLPCEHPPPLNKQLMPFSNHYNPGQLSPRWDSIVPTALYPSDPRYPIYDDGFNIQHSSFIDDMLSIVADEARHFMQCCERLEKLSEKYKKNLRYGSQPATFQLWVLGVNTRRDIAERLAVIPLSQEARGLDSTTRFVDKLYSVGDKESALVVTQIGKEEERHVALGVKWLLYTAAARGVIPSAYAAEYDYAKLPFFHLSEPEKWNYQGPKKQTKALREKHKNETALNDVHLDKLRSTNDILNMVGEDENVIPEELKEYLVQPKSRDDIMTEYFETMNKQVTTEKLNSFKDLPEVYDKKKYQYNLPLGYFDADGRERALLPPSSEEDVGYIEGLIPSQYGEESMTSGQQEIMDENDREFGYDPDEYIPTPENPHPELSPFHPKFVKPTDMTYEEVLHGLYSGDGKMQCVNGWWIYSGKKERQALRDQGYDISETSTDNEEIKDASDGDLFDAIHNVPADSDIKIPDFLKKMTADEYRKMSREDFLKLAKKHLLETGTRPEDLPPFFDFDEDMFNNNNLRSTPIDDDTQLPAELDVYPTVGTYVERGGRTFLQLGGGIKNGKRIPIEEVDITNVSPSKVARLITTRGSPIPQGAYTILGKNNKVDLSRNDCLIKGKNGKLINLGSNRDTIHKVFGFPKKELVDNEYESLMDIMRDEEESSELTTTTTEPDYRFENPKDHTLYVHTIFPELRQTMHQRNKAHYEDELAMSGEYKHNNKNRGPLFQDGKAKNGKNNDEDRVLSPYFDHNDHKYEYLDIIKERFGKEIDVDSILQSNKYISSELKSKIAQQWAMDKHFETYGLPLLDRERRRKRFAKMRETYRKYKNNPDDFNFRPEVRAQLDEFPDLEFYTDDDDVFMLPPDMTMAKINEHIDKLENATEDQCRALRKAFVANNGYSLKKRIDWDDDMRNPSKSNSFYDSDDDDDDNDEKAKPDGQLVTTLPKPTSYNHKWGSDSQYNLASDGEHVDGSSEANSDNAIFQSDLDNIDWHAWFAIPTRRTLYKRDKKARATLQQKRERFARQREHDDKVLEKEHKRYQNVHVNRALVTARRGYLDQMLPRPPIHVGNTLTIEKTLPQEIIDFCEGKMAEFWQVNVAPHFDKGFLPPFNRLARYASGMPESWYIPLSTPELPVHFVTVPPNAPMESPIRKHFKRLEDRLNYEGNWWHDLPQLPVSLQENIETNAKLSFEMLWQKSLREGMLDGFLKQKAFIRLDEEGNPLSGSETEDSVENEAEGGSEDNNGENDTKTKRHNKSKKTALQLNPLQVLPFLESTYPKYDFTGFDIYDYHHIQALRKYSNDFNLESLPHNFMALYTTGMDKDGKTIDPEVADEYNLIKKPEEGWRNKIKNLPAKIFSGSLEDDLKQLKIWQDANAKTIRARQKNAAAYAGKNPTNNHNALRTALEDPSHPIHFDGVDYATILNPKNSVYTADGKINYHKPVVDRKGNKINYKRSFKSIAPNDAAVYDKDGNINLTNEEWLEFLDQPGHSDMMYDAQKLIDYYNFLGLANGDEDSTQKSPLDISAHRETVTNLSTDDINGHVSPGSLIKNKKWSMLTDEQRAEIRRITAALKHRFYLAKRTVSAQYDIMTLGEINKQAMGVRPGQPYRHATKDGEKSRDDLDVKTVSSEDIDLDKLTTAFSAFDRISKRILDERAEVFDADPDDPAQMERAQLRAKIIERQNQIDFEALPREDQIEYNQEVKKEIENTYTPQGDRIGDVMKSLPTFGELDPDHNEAPFANFPPQMVDYEKMIVRAQLCKVFNINVEKNPANIVLPPNSPLKLHQTNPDGPSPNDKPNWDLFQHSMLEQLLELDKYDKGKSLEIYSRAILGNQEYELIVNGQTSNITQSDDITTTNVTKM